MKTPAGEKGETSLKKCKFKNFYSFKWCMDRIITRQF